jgi:hypothetical protein
MRGVRRQARDAVYVHARLQASRVRVSVLQDDFENDVFGRVSRNPENV